MSEARYARRSARVLLVDALDRLLLFRSGDEWFTPGGGIEADETAAEAASRELAEETGLRVAPESLGPLVAETSGFTDLGWVRGVCQDSFFFLRARRMEVDTSGFTALEVSTVVEHRWWTVAELAGTAATVYPLGLVPLLGRLLAGRVPAEPVQLPWRD